MLHDMVQNAKYKAEFLYQKLTEELYKYERFDYDPVHCCADQTRKTLHIYIYIYVRNIES